MVINESRTASFARTTSTNSEDLFRQPVAEASSQRWILAGDSRVKHYWDTLISILIAVSAVESLLYVSYDDEGLFITCVEYSLWSFFVLDFLLTFLTSYEDADGRAVKSLRDIAIHYLKGWLVLDVIALTPLMFFGYQKYQQYLQFIRIFKLKRTLDLIDGTWIIAILSLIYGIQTVDRLVTVKSVSRYAILILRQLTIILFFTFLMGALFRKFAQTIESNSQEKFNEERIRGHLTVTQKLIISWYFATTMLSSVGYGDLTPVSAPERAFVIAMIVIGTIVLSIIVAEFTGVVREIDELRQRRRVDQELLDWIKQCEQLKKRIPEALKLRIYYHFHHYWLKDRLGSVSAKWWQCNSAQEMSTSPDPFFSQLPTQEKHTILQLLFGDVFFAYSRFFLPVFGFRFDIALHLQPRVYSPGETILSECEVPKEIYFHSSGLLHCGLHRNGSFVAFLSFFHRAIIGDLQILLKSESPVTYKVAETGVAKAFVLPSKPFKVLLRDKYPKLQRKMTAFARMRFNRTKRALDSYLRQIPYEDLVSSFAGSICCSFMTDLQSPRLSLDDLYRNLAALRVKERRMTEEYHQQRDRLMTEVTEKVEEFTRMAIRGLRVLTNR